MGVLNLASQHIFKGPSQKTQQGVIFQTFEGIQTCFSLREKQLHLKRVQWEQRHGVTFSSDTISVVWQHVQTGNGS